MRSMNASEFKAKSLAILDEVAATGEPVLILKRGRPVAQLVAPLASGDEYPQRELAGSVQVVDDLIEPAVPSTAWEVEGSAR